MTVHWSIHGFILNPRLSKAYVESEFKWAGIKRDACINLVISLFLSIFFCISQNNHRSFENFSVWVTMREKCELLLISSNRGSQFGLTHLAVWRCSCLRGIALGFLLLVVWMDMLVNLYKVSTSGDLKLVFLMLSIWMSFSLRIWPFQTICASY